MVRRDKKWGGLCILSNNVGIHLGFLQDFVHSLRVPLLGPQPEVSGSFVFLMLAIDGACFRQETLRFCKCNFLHVIKRGFRVRHAFQEIAVQGFWVISSADLVK